MLYVWIVLASISVICFITGIICKIEKLISYSIPVFVCGIVASFSNYIYGIIACLPFLLLSDYIITKYIYNNNRNIKNKLSKLHISFDDLMLAKIKEKNKTEKLDKIIETIYLSKYMQNNYEKPFIFTSYDDKQERWYDFADAALKSAYDGDINAQINIGKDFLGTKHIQPDYKMAKKWLKKASNANNQEAIDLLITIEDKK